MMKKIFLILSIVIILAGCDSQNTDNKKITKKYFCIQRKDLMNILISSPTDNHVILNESYFFFDSLDNLMYSSFDENFYVPVSDFHNLDNVTLKKSRYSCNTFNYLGGLVSYGSDFIIPFNSIKNSKIVEK